MLERYYKNTFIIIYQTNYTQYGDKPAQEDVSEFKENYINPTSTRPIIYKIPDHDSLIKVHD